MFCILICLLFAIALCDEIVLPNDIGWGSCKHYTEKELFFHLLNLTCPLDYEDKCDDPIFDPFGQFKYRCQVVYPYDEMLLTVEIINASTLLRMLQHTDIYKRTWCMITLFYSPTCPFSARIAPYFNALPGVYNAKIKFVAFDATEFTKLNSRYGVSGTPAVMLWVSGAAVARMEDRQLNDEGLMSFIYDWTDVQPVFGAVHAAEDPLHIEYDDRPDVFYLSLSLLVACAVVLYCLRERISENARVRAALTWISAKIDTFGDYMAPPARPEQR